MKSTTAEEILEKHWKLKTDFPMDDVIKLNMQYCVESMQEYATMKCKELLEIVAEKATVKTKYKGLLNNSIFIDKDSILNTVDLESFCK